MQAMQQWSAWISPKADKLAKELIIEFQIQSGYGVALFLDVNKMFTNHVAVRIWVQRKLDDGVDELSDPFGVLSQQFYECIPDY